MSGVYTLQGAGERSSSPEEELGGEYECELMIEALRRELDIVREQLAFVTHQLDTRGQLLVTHQPTLVQRSPAQSSPKSESPHMQKKVSPLAGSKADTSKADQEMAASQWAKQKRFLDVVDEVEGRRWGLRKECLRLMQKHIEQQLQRLQESSHRLRRRLRRRQDKARAARLQLKPARFRSSGTDDKSFLANLYQSTFYQIVELEHKLRKAGKLNSLADLKDFWDAMLSPPTPTPTKERAPPPPLPHPPPIWQEEEEDYGTSWAITALPPEHYRKVERYSKSHTPTTARASASTASVRFLPMKLPELRPVAHILNEGRPHSNERKELTGHVVRMQELMGGKRRTQQMYQQARANEIAMRRLLPDLEPPSFDPSPSIEVSELEHTAHKTPERPTELQQRVSRPDSYHIRKPHDQKEESLSLRLSPTPPPPPLHAAPPPPLHAAPPPSLHTAPSPPLHTAPSPPLRAAPPRPMEPPWPPTKPVVVPLTMDSVVREGEVKEFKGKSALWSNYIPAN